MPFDGLSFVRPQPPRLLPAGEFELDRGHPLAAGLAGYWPLTGSLRDYSGNRYDGQGVGAQSFGVGLSGPAALYSTASDQVNVPSQPLLSGPQTFAISFYFTGTDFYSGGGYYGILGAVNFHANYGNGLVVDHPSATTSTVHLISAVNDMNWWNNLSAPIALNTWYHVVGTLTGIGSAQTGLLYMNGSQVASYTGTSAIYGYPWTIGYAGTGSNGPHTRNAYLSGAGYWNRVLSAAEIARLYAEPFGMLRPRVRRTFAVVGGGINPATGAPTLPALAASGTGAQTNAGAGAATLAPLTASGAGSQTNTGVGTAVLPPLVATGTGTQANVGIGAALLPALTAAGTGGAVGTNTGTGAATLSVLAASGAGVQANAGAGTATIGTLSAAGAASLVNIGTGSAILTLIASGAGIQVNVGSGAATLAALTASGASEASYAAPPAPASRTVVFTPAPRAVVFSPLPRAVTFTPPPRTVVL